MKVRHNATGKVHPLPKAEFEALAKSVPQNTYTIVEADDEKLPAELKPKKAEASKPAVDSAPIAE